MSRSRLAAFCLGSVILLAGAARADVIKLRAGTGCAGESGTCLDDSNGGLDAVLLEIHQPTPPRQTPSAANPVVVDIGPGSFALTDTTYAYCDGSAVPGISHLTFRGADRVSTTLTGGGYPDPLDVILAYAPYVVLIRDCTELAFQDLTIRNDEAANAAVRFKGNGVTYWTNVTIVADSAYYPIGWVDSSQDASASEHYWWNADVQAILHGAGTAPWSLIAGSSTHEIKASEFYSEGINLGSPFLCLSNCQLRIEGSSAISVGTGSALGFDNRKNAWQLGYPPCDGQKISLEGSRVEVTAGTTGTAIKDECPNSALVSVHGTQFRIQATTAKRINSTSGKVEAPHSLGAGTNPPTQVTSSWSLKGQDSFVETDCGLKCTGTSQGAEPHLLVFDPACTTDGPWFDTVTAKCRGL